MGWRGRAGIMMIIIIINIIIIVIMSLLYWVDIVLYTYWLVLDGSNTMVALPCEVLQVAGGALLGSRRPYTVAHRRGGLSVLWFVHLLCS